MAAKYFRVTGLSLLITAASATVSSAYSVQAVLIGREVTAQYAAARSAALSLAVGTVIARPAWRTRQVIAGLGLTMGPVQLLDAGMGFGQRDLVKTLGRSHRTGRYQLRPGCRPSRPLRVNDATTRIRWLPEHCPRPPQQLGYKAVGQSDGGWRSAAADTALVGRPPYRGPGPAWISSGSIAAR